MIGRGSLRVALVALAALVAGCGGLGVDPAGKIHCGPKPTSACPSGLKCVYFTIDAGNDAGSVGICERLGADAAAGAEGDASSDGDAAPSGDGHPDVAVDAPSGGDTAPADGGQPDVVTCPMNQHLCPLGCVMDDSPQTCGSSCSPCLEPANGGTATCDGTQCGGACPTGKSLCLGSCIDSTAACSGTCGAGTHLCGQSCPSTHDVNACGSLCVPCPVTANAVAATCDGTKCGFTCNNGYHPCGTACTGDTDPGGCGAACVACPTDPNGAAICAGGQCSLQCKATYHLCGTKCVSNSDVGSCGASSCMPCSAITNGTATCDGTKCGGSCAGGLVLCNGACIASNAPCSGQCGTGTHNCSSVCVDSTSTNSCGTLCSACTKPTGANQTSCDGTTCSFTCGQGYHLCGSGCSADSDATACGTTCKKCPTDPNGTATCTGGTCGLSCALGYHACGGVCVSNKDVNNCGAVTCGTPCTAPTGGTVSCDGTSCVQACTSSSQYVCGAACINKTQACNGQCPSSAYKLCAGACILATSCCTNADCGSNTPLCSGGTCVQRPNGQACAGTAECASGNCVDGFCCDTACTGQCQACDIKAGTCSPVPSMGAPHNGRAACGAAPCTGYCDGTTTASCHFPANQCAAQMCSAGIQTNAATCDSGGHCPAGATTSCTYLCVGNACGGSCHPGTYQCTGANLQYCNAGTWQTQATCAGATPKCDANQQKCVPFALGDSCTSTTQCGTNFCSWGVCCSQQCDTTCTSSCGGGSCKAIADGTTCKTKTYDAPGLNNVYFTCKGGTCKAPKIICNNQEGCDLTNNVCCGDSFSDTIGCMVSVACPASASNEIWLGCGSSADCPTGLACLFYFQDVGDRYTECVSPSMLGTYPWSYEVCDPNLTGNTCIAAAGTSCAESPGSNVAGLCQ